MLLPHRAMANFRRDIQLNGLSVLRTPGKGLGVVKTMRPRAMFVPAVFLVGMLYLVAQFSSIYLSERETDQASINRAPVSRIYDQRKAMYDLTQIGPRVKHETKRKAHTARGNNNKFCDKRSERDTGYCIFDLGLHKGQDTVQYLAGSPDVRVLSVEANPTLARNGREKFRDAIASSRLKLLNIGLVGNETANGKQRPKLEFWINLSNDLFSSFGQVGGCRDKRGNRMEEGNTEHCRKIEMDTRSCSELIKEYGTPFYMKVDIEGMDRSCVRSLGNVPYKSRPKYISVENVQKQDVDMFSELGYRRFKVVNQNALQQNLTSKEIEGHSGPWGEGASDFWIGKKWHSGKELMDRLPLPASIMVNGKRLKGWYDMHASM